MEVYQYYVRRMLIWLCVATVAVAVILYAVGGERYVTGWLWGGGTNCVYFIVLAGQVKKWPSVPPDKLKQKIRMTVVSRFVLILAMTAIATRIPDMNMLGVLAGMVVLKPLQYIEYLWGRRRKSESR